MDETMDEDSPRVMCGDVWVADVIRLLGFDGKRVRRVIIDAEIRKPIRVWVECFGTTQLLKVDPLNPEAVEIMIQGSVV
jgi:hypothetical protein